MNKCWILFAVVTIVMALLITSARFLLPHLETFHQQIEETISGAVGATVEVRSIEASWHGAGPQLKIQGVRVLSDGRELLRFERGSVGLDLWQSLLHGAIQVGSLVVSGIELVVTRDEHGKIGVTGFEAAQTEKEEKPDSEQALLSWLFSQPRMAIESSEVTWRDLKLGGRELHFSNVAFELRNRDGRHQLDGAAELPVHLGRTLSFALDIDGDPTFDQGWNARGYVEGGELQLSQWLEGKAPVGVRVDQGLVETRLWLEWQNAVLQRAEGVLSLRQLLLTPVGESGGVEAREPMLINLLSGRYLWQRDAAGWSLTVDDFMLGRENQMWSPSQFSVASSGWVEGEQTIEARLGYARIDDIAALLQMANVVDEATRRQLSALAPTGELRDGYLHFWDPARDKKQDYHFLFSSRFENIGVNAAGKLPGLSGFDGRVRVDNRGGYLALESTDAALSFPTLFRDPLAITTLTGDLYWLQQRDRWQLESRSLQLKNSDVELSLALAVTKTLNKGDGAAEIALLADFNAPSVSNVSHYLPVGVMPKGVVDWLDRAIIDGNAAAGQMVFYGPLDERFPYRESDGLFDIRFNLSDGILDYAPGWPRLEEMEAEVVFSGSSMAINAVAARSLDADVTQVTVKIDDFRASPYALLEIDGRARGDARDTLDFVRRSPLNKKFGAFAKDVEVVAGRSTVALSIDLPLTDLPAKVAGTVHFEQADFYLAERAVDLLAVNGDLKFTENGVAIEKMQARLLGMDAVLRARTLPAVQGGATVIDADGRASAADIQRLISSVLLQRIAGEAPWQAQLTIPQLTTPEVAATDSSAGFSSTLRVTSTLQGMTIDYPPPLGKSAAQSEPFVMEVAFPRSLDAPMQLQYGPQLRAILDLDEAMALQRGAITIGGGSPVMPDKARVSVGGRFSSLSLDEWLPIIELAAQQPAGRGSSPVEIEQLNLEIEQASAFGVDFHYTSLDLLKASGLWQGDVSSHLMGGQLIVPTDFDRDALEMALDYLILPGATTDQNSSTVGEDVAVASEASDDETDPRRLPAMKINSRYFSYAEQPLGRLELLTTRRQAGVHVDLLQLASPLMDVSARGDWLVANDEQYSSFNITINSDDTGAMMATLGIADGLRDGKSEIGVIARWPGSPVAFAVARLSGNMHLKIEDGRLLDVEPGAGRVFGLISMQALPRRLTLDFSDMFKKGFSFDRMVGDFEINEGDASTTNFRVEGPAATITVTGRVGLADKDYDQHVIVEPHVASSLPIVGAVVGSLGIGAAIFLAQKLLNLNEVAQVTYRVTGSWDAPVVTREDVTLFDGGGKR